MKYKVEILETLRKEVEQEADNETEALDTVYSKYHKGEIVLDASDCIGADLLIIKEDDTEINSNIQS